MRPFTQETAAMLRLPVANVDTDQLIPARFMKEPRKPEGYGRFLLHDLAAEGSAPAPQAGQAILVARRNFGCGSSREAAVYALADFGFRAVIAPSFGDIFFSNALKNGLLPIRLPVEIVDNLLGQIAAEQGAQVKVDLAAQTVTAPDGTTHRFAIDPFAKHCLVNGIDELDYTLSQMQHIVAFERRHEAENR